MRVRDLRQLSETELETKLAGLTEERFRLRFRSASESVDNPIRFRTMRRDIARITTILHDRRGGGDGG